MSIPWVPNVGMNGSEPQGRSAFGRDSTRVLHNSYPRVEHGTRAVKVDIKIQDKMPSTSDPST